MTVYYINRRYRVASGIFAGLEGKLVAYDATTDEAIVELGKDERVALRGSMIELSDKKPYVPKRKKFLVYVNGNYVRDAVVFEAPQHFTEEEVCDFIRSLEKGGAKEIDNYFYGWRPTNSLPIVLGIVEANSEEEAIGMFSMHKLTLGAYEIV